MGQIISIVYRPRELRAKPFDHFTRVSLDSATLRENYGIDGDAKGGHPERNINIMSHETLAALAEKGFKVAPGQMGEQLVIGELGADLNLLPRGTRLRLGESAVAEVTQPRVGCERFEQIQDISPIEAPNQMGILVRVVVGGQIAVGDSVEIMAS